ncbi:MAG: alternative ribosome rescue aminoacyl-tRNA hydrolase ArfB [bacterium]
MEDDLYINETLTVPAGELNFKASRSGGPGGQHVNKTSSRVTLEWNVESSTVLSSLQKLRIYKHLGGRINTDGVFQLSVDESRSQHANRDLARRRFADLLKSALKVQKKRLKTKPSKSAKARRVDEKKKVGQKKRNRTKPSHDE